MRKLFSILLIAFLFVACSLFEQGKIKIDIKKDTYSVSARYPKLQSPKNRKIIKDFVMKEIKVFESTYGTDLGADDYNFKINYRTKDSKKYKSFIFKLKTFEEGELVNYYFKTFVFNKETEELLTIDKVLDSDLKKVATAQLVRDKLKEKISEEYYDKDRVYRATNPQNLKNFKNFYYNKKGELHILFNPLQLASIEAGHFNIAVKL